MKFNEEKFNKLVHYICYKSNPKKLGAIKLNKILFYSDFISYVANGEPITNELYIKRQFGPVPKDILSSLEKLASESKIVIHEITVYKKKKREFVSIAEPEIDGVFKAHEISLVDEIISDITENRTAKSISDQTHDHIWESAIIGEEIPYKTAHVMIIGEINEEDISWADENIKLAI